MHAGRKRLLNSMTLPSAGPAADRHGSKLSIASGGRCILQPSWQRGRSLPVVWVQFIAVAVLLLAMGFPVDTFLIRGVSQERIESGARVDWRVGVSRRDITPDEPLRLSGYAVREESHQGVADPLHVRAMVLTPSPHGQTEAEGAGRRSGTEASKQAEHAPAGDAGSLILVSIDSIAVTSSMTVEVAEWLEETFGLTRRQLVLCSTHSHTAPHLAGGLDNLFTVPSTDEQAAATARYAERLIGEIQQAILEAWEARTEASLSIAESRAEFAVNRRVLSNGTWQGFGEVPDGPVDHRVRVFSAKRPDASLLAVAYQYACHCTTHPVSFNQISGDWAGISASRLEQRHSTAVFLPVIGCGADANPLSRSTEGMAGQHAAELVGAVEQALQSDENTELNVMPEAHFGYAGLAPEQPTDERVQQMLQSDRPNERRWAEHMVKVKEEMGRLPETYPMPIHTWNFGPELTWVFLGGEVVVDYQFLIEKDLSSEQTWVAAYCDDVFGYVASERMRSEGGYEVDFSMIYYLQPGRWQAGTQGLILQRVKEIFQQPAGAEQPLSAEEALSSMHVPEGYRVEMVASEPLVQDPINLAFDTDGSVWVVEMADYPEGIDGGGRIKRLFDSDADGQLDQAQLFLSGLEYPTSVHPWRDGVIVIAAPEVFFAADRDEDGRADHRETLLTGLARANPQHRASGFEIGLDGWWHFTAGHGTNELQSLRNGQTYEVRGHDVAWNPDTGEIRTTSGETQFVRARDAYGNWFGNSNSHPIYHYVIEERYRDAKAFSGDVSHHLLSPATAPPVLPRSRTADRFNDLFASNRYTSACSSLISRSPGVSDSPRQGTEQDTPTMVGLICEPVHNLVSRIKITREGTSFRAIRHPDDVDYEFFTSTHQWSRPVRVINAPDGTIWIVDMVRQVIEHPEWIPVSWQQRLNLRDGFQLGRIYRVYREDFTPTDLPQLGPSPDALLTAMSSSHGALRDLAVQRIVELAGSSSAHGDSATESGELKAGRLSADREQLQRGLRDLATSHSAAEVRASAWGGLAAANWLKPEDTLEILRDRDSRIVCIGLRLSESWPSPPDALRQAIARLPSQKLGAEVDLQWVLTVSQMTGIEATDGLHSIATRWPADAWTQKALTLVSDGHQALAVLRGMLDAMHTAQEVSSGRFSVTGDSLRALWQRLAPEKRLVLAETYLSRLQDTRQEAFRPDELLMLSLLARSEIVDSGEAEGGLARQIDACAERVESRLLAPATPEAERQVLVNLIGRGLMSADQDQETIAKLLEHEGLIGSRRGVIEAMRRMPEAPVPDLLLNTWSRLSAAERSAACATLMSRRGWVAALVESLEAGDLQRHDLDMATEQQLRSYGDRSLRTRCEQVFGRPTVRSQVVAEYLQAMPAPARSDAELAVGGKLFDEHCAACHRPQDDRQVLGAPLENLIHWPLDQWVTAILAPNQAIEPKYQQSNILTIDGQVQAGLVLERTTTQVQLALSDGSRREFDSDEIESIRETGISLMPEGFEQKLSPEQLSQLIGFLRHGESLQPSSGAAGGSAR